MKLSIGNLCDQLSICNCRIWAAEDIKRRPDATNDEIAAATKITNVANQMRTDLIQAIDERINELIMSGKPQKLYKQGDTKMYGKK